MTTTLTYQTESPPQGLPGTTTLRFDSALGTGLITHDLGDPQPVFHTRLFFNAEDMMGGSLVVAGGMDDSGFAVWHLRFDAANRSLQFRVGSADCTVELSSALAWHSVELSLDTSSGMAKLRLNGIERASLSIAANPTRYAWVGGAFTSGSLTGTIDFDHWVLGTSPIGVPLVNPSADHAGDPCCWLVVYNRNLSDSIVWADTYRARRGVPYANLCGLDLPTDETIDAADFNVMREAIAGYLADNHLGDQIVGLLLGFGVPGYTDLASQGTLTPVTSYLHSDDSHADVIVNPLHQDPLITRPAASSFGGVRLTGRIDGPDLASALAFMDRADAMLREPLRHDRGAVLWVDREPDNPNVGPALTGLVQAWSEGLSIQRLRIPTVVQGESALTSVRDDAFVWGWRSAAPPPDFFGMPAGRRALCLQFEPEPVGAASVRNPAADDWLTTAIQAGYAAGAVASRAYSISAMPLPTVLFEALAQGWTLAEAWLVAKPFLRDSLQLLGDPLMRIAFPKSGFDLYGPVDRIDQIDFDQPSAALHDGVNAFQLDLSTAPEPGEPQRYLVRRLDDQGRPDFAATGVAYATVQVGESVRPALPAWPDHPGWRVGESDVGVLIAAVWPASLKQLDVDRVRLLTEAEGGLLSIAHEWVPVVGQRRVKFALPRPAEQTRYCLRIIQGPASFDTPWSGWVGPSPAPNIDLTLLEQQT